MYEQFYGLKDKPFSMLPDPGFLYLSKKHQAALTLLEYGLMNNVGFCVISGETGAGKTTLLRKLLGRLDDSYRVGMITNTHQSFGSLLDWILSAFNQHEKGLSHVEMHQKLMDFLIAEYANNRKILLIVDEAQNMNAATLEELRMLSNVNSEKDQLMQVILAGQPALKDTLRIPELMQFAQRIGVDYHLGDLDVGETTHYIQHRLRTAGATQDIFTAAACARIHSYSGGTPRLVNLLCDTVLVYGFADQCSTIDVELIDEMVTERMKDSVVPLVNRDSPKIYSEQELKELEENFPSIKDMLASERIQLEKQQAEAAVQAASQVTSQAVSDKQQNPVSEKMADERASPVAATATETAGVDDVSDNKVVNKVEILQPEPEDDSDQWWVYGLIVIILVVVLFIVYKSNILVISQSPAVVPEPIHQRQSVELAIEHERQVLEAERQRLREVAQQRKKRQQAAAMKVAEHERAGLAAEKVEKALKAAALEQEVQRAAGVKKPLVTQQKTLEHERIAEGNHVQKKPAVEKHGLTAPAAQSQPAKPTVLPQASQADFNLQKAVTTKTAVSEQAVKKTFDEQAVVPVTTKPAADEALNKAANTPVEVAAGTEPEIVAQSKLKKVLPEIDAGLKTKKKKQQNTSIFPVRGRQHGLNPIVVSVV